MDTDKIQIQIRELNRKLFLLFFENDEDDRKRILDSLLFDKEGELHQLKKLVGLDEKD